MTDLEYYSSKLLRYYKTLKDKKLENQKLINFNIDVPAAKLYIQLQRLTDVLKFSTIAKNCVIEKEFNEFYEFSRFVIASNHVLHFEEAKEKFQQWCLKNSFRDCVENISLFLDECHFVCELLAARKNDKVIAEDFTKIVGSSRKKFHREGLPKKIKILHNNFNICSPLEEHVISLNTVRNCLVHRNGIVRQDDLNTKTELVAKFRELQIIAVSPDKANIDILTCPTVLEEGYKVCIKTEDIEIHFKLGESINFRPKEHANTVFTFYMFAVDIYKSIYKNANIKTNVKIKPM